MAGALVTGLAVGAAIMGVGVLLGYIISAASADAASEQRKSENNAQ